MHLIDLHTHLLPHWDDGSDSWETSLAMLRQGIDDGIREVACTPHVMSKGDFDKEEKIIRLFEELKERAEDARLDIRLHLGSELFVQPEIDFSRRVATYAANGRYFLVEFPMNLIPDFVAKTFFEYVQKEMVPVVAHPERYAKILNDPSRAYEFVEHGAVLQVNAGSLLGVFGQKVKTTAMKLIDANLVSLVSSDAHDLKMRPFKLRAAFELVEAQWGLVKANRLFCENPHRILYGKELIMEEPVRPGMDYTKKETNSTLKTILKKIGL